MSDKLDLSVDALSKLTVYMKYAKYLPDLQRRESWDDICDRYQEMMISKYPTIDGSIIEAMEHVRSKKVLPSMRALQFAGPAISKNEARIYNCAFLPVDDLRAFSETMFLLLGGTGVGYSVQYHHVAKLPEIHKPSKERKFLIGDSIEGWADAVKALMKSYLGETNSKPRFDFNDIRAKGAALITAGGKAPGPAPLKECLFKIEQILESKENGSKLTPLNCHDIQCHIANAVLAGGIRRAAMISLFSFDDQDMLTCKYGSWWELNEQRGRANNSAAIVRHRIKKSEFFDLWSKIEASGSGEPGLYFTNDADWGTNPCCEIALRSFQFCNLTEVNVSDITSQQDLNARVAYASLLGTLQAGFTDFHYLRPEWKQITEKDALVGVGMTGIASGKVLNYNLQEAAEIAKVANGKVAKLLGINAAARVTTVKPSGTSSCVLGTSSGVHAWHNDYYLRRIRIGKNEALYTYLAINHPELIEDEFFRPDTQAVIGIPQKAPTGSIMRTESALDTLERTKKFNLEWVREGHRSGANTNNVSATISIQPQEWKEVGIWMWENRKSYNGLSVLPADNGSYKQAPFENITEKEYNKLYKSLTTIDLMGVVELTDDTNLTGEAACAGGACEVK
jgi:ribonucleoside-triphosphate reductase